MVETSKSHIVISSKVPELKITYTENQKQELLKKLKMGTKEWAGRNVNCIKGCGIGCLYCYAKGIAKHYRGYDEDTWKMMQVNDQAVEKNYNKSNKKTSAPWDIMFPTTHNIFIEDPYFSACTKVLKNCLNSGNAVLVTIKPTLPVVKRLCTLFEKYKSTFGFRFTIGSVNSNILKTFEPHGSSFEERVESLKHATNQGFSTTVSAEPLLDKDPFDLIEKISPYLSSLDYKNDTGTIWIGLLKTQYISQELRKGPVKKFLEELKKSIKFENVFSYYRELYSNKRIKWKESVLKLMIKNDIMVDIAY